MLSSAAFQGVGATPAGKVALTIGWPAFDTPMQARSADTLLRIKHRIMLKPARLHAWMLAPMRLACDNMSPLCWCRPLMYQACCINSRNNMTL